MILGEARLLLGQWRSELLGTGVADTWAVSGVTVPTTLGGAVPGAPEEQGLTGFLTLQPHYTLFWA